MARSAVGGEKSPLSSGPSRWAGPPRQGKKEKGEEGIESIFAASFHARRPGAGGEGKKSGLGFPETICRGGNNSMKRRTRWGRGRKRRVICPGSVPVSFTVSGAGRRGRGRVRVVDLPSAYSPDPQRKEKRKAHNAHFYPVAPGAQERGPFVPTPFPSLKRGDKGRILPSPRTRADCSWRGGGGGKGKKKALQPS